MRLTAVGTEPMLAKANLSVCCRQLFWVVGMTFKKRAADADGFESESVRPAFKIKNPINTLNSNFAISNQASKLLLASFDPFLVEPHVFDGLAGFRRVGIGDVDHSVAGLDDGGV